MLQASQPYAVLHLPSCSDVSPRTLGDDPHCLARLVPYLKFKQEELAALTEIVELCKRGSRYVEDVIAVGLLPLLPRLLGGGPQIKTLATALVAAIAQDDAIAEQLTQMKCVLRECGGWCDLIH